MRSARMPLTPCIAASLVAPTAAGCTTSTSTDPQSLSEAERAAIADTVRRINREAGETFDSDLDCAEIVDRLSVPGGGNTFVAQANYQGDGMHRILLTLALLSILPGAAARAQPPATPVRPVVDTLYGTPVQDPYQWLEAGDSEELVAWFRAQGAYARGVLDALPGREPLLQRIRAIGAVAPPDVSLPREAGGRWFYTIRRATESVPTGYVRDAWTGEERVLVDPATVGGTGGTGANTLSSYLPSPDGRLLLYGVTTGGSENAVLRVRDVASGRDVEGPIERNRWDYNQWSPDGRAFFYIQLRDLPAGASPADYYRGIRILRHRLGEDVASDVEVFSAGSLGADEGLLPFLTLDARSGLAFGLLTPGTEHGAWFVAPVAGLAGGSPDWRPLFTLADSVVSVAPYGAELYALTRKGTPRIVRTPLDAPDLGAAETVMVEGEQRIQGLNVALDGLYVGVFADGANRITRIPWSGRPKPLDVPPGASVAPSPANPFESRIQADPLRSGVVLMLNSWTSISRPYRYDPSTDVLEELPLRPRGPYDHLEGFTAETVFAPSHDGVRVPLTIVRPERFERDGAMPIVLVGYGAYGSTEDPDYRPERGPWHESGGAIANCHVRGGGYYGGAWHQAGQKTTKPNTWLDFIACAEFLIREGYTRSERLVALGASAGGITVGRAITERPELFAGAVIHNGLLDAVRLEKMPGGPQNTHEFGSVTTEEGFRALLAMSSMHHVRPGTAYPAVLLVTSLNDTRVAPWESGKMAAALQATSTSGRPVLLRVDEAGGHMAAGYAAEQIQQILADQYAFIMAQTGVPTYRTPDPSERR